jgi:hypothetical protein
VSADAGQQRPCTREDCAAVCEYLAARVMDELLERSPTNPAEQSRLRTRRRAFLAAAEAIRLGHGAEIEHLAT